MELDQDEMQAVVKRLKRAQGQIGGIVKMIDDGRECQDIVTQLAAVSKALDRAGFAVIALGLRQCITDPESHEMDVEHHGEALPVARVSARGPMDAADWDRRYAGADLVWSVGPNGWVRELAAPLPPGRGARRRRRRGAQRALAGGAGVGRRRHGLLARRRDPDARDRRPPPGRSAIPVHGGRRRRHAPGSGPPGRRGWHGLRPRPPRVPPAPPPPWGVALSAAVEATAPGGVVLVVGPRRAQPHRGGRRSPGRRGPLDPEDVVASAAGLPVQVELAQLRRREVEGSHSPALDTVVLLRRVGEDRCSLTQSASVSYHVVRRERGLRAGEAWKPQPPRTRSRRLPASAGRVDEHDAARRCGAHRRQGRARRLEAEWLVGRQQPTEVEPAGAHVLEERGAVRGRHAVTAQHVELAGDDPVHGHVRGPVGRRKQPDLHVPAAGRQREDAGAARLRRPRASMLTAAPPPDHAVTAATTRSGPIEASTTSSAPWKSARSQGCRRHVDRADEGAAAARHRHRGQPHPTAADHDDLLATLHRGPGDAARCAVATRHPSPAATAGSSPSGRATRLVSAA